METIKGVETWGELYSRLFGGEANHGPSTSGLNLTVPASIIAGLADQGCNAREVMTRFWQNASPMLLINVAYPDRVSGQGGTSEAA